MPFERLSEDDGLIVSRSPWGDKDDIGRLNWMTAESRANILRRADGSTIYDLAVDYFMGMPSWTEALDPKYEIWMTHTPRGTLNDNLSHAGEAANRAYSYAGTAFAMYSHTGTHLCGLNHIGYRGQFWNGWTTETHLGSRAWSIGGVFPPIVARAVLLDVPAAKGIETLPDRYAISAQDIVDTIAQHGIRIQHGDVVLVRTGRMRQWPDQETFLSNPPGLSVEAAKCLCDEFGRHVPRPRLRRRSTTVSSWHLLARPCLSVRDRRLPTLREPLA